MNRRSGRTLLAVGGALLLIGGLGAPAATAQPVPSWARVSTATPSGDASPSAMTRAAARKAYRAAVCPMNAAIAALDAGTPTKEVVWPSVQALMLATAAQQRRTAGLLLHPRQPWPEGVRDAIGVVGEFVLRSSAAMEVLASTPTQEDFEVVVTALDAATGTQTRADEKAAQKANTVIKARLGIKGDNCPNQ